MPLHMLRSVFPCWVYVQLTWQKWSNTQHRHSQFTPIPTYPHLNYCYFLRPEQNWAVIGGWSFLPSYIPFFFFSKAIAKYQRQPFSSTLDCAGDSCEATLRAWIPASQSNSHLFNCQTFPPQRQTELIALYSVDMNSISEAEKQLKAPEMKEPAVEGPLRPGSLLGFPQYAFQLTIFMWSLVSLCHLLLNKLWLQRSQRDNLMLFLSTCVVDRDTKPTHSIVEPSQLVELFLFWGLLSFSF